ncbi:hypothetical protein [Sphingorhabdus lacus]
MLRLADDPDQPCANIHSMAFRKNLRNRRED